MIGISCRLALIDVFRALGSWRWLPMVPLLFVSGYLATGYVQYSPDAVYRNLNWWDGPLSMMVNSSVVLFMFGLGFIFVTGDLYTRDRSSGTFILTLLRSRSRFTWWSAKVLALGILALVYSVMALSIALAASATQLPLSLTRSSVARIPWGFEGAIYPSFEGLSIYIFFLLVVLYTALGLWAVGALILGITALYPHDSTSLVVGSLWVILGSNFVSPLYQRTGIGTLDPMYQISYAVHFGSHWFQAISWLTSLCIIVLSVTTAIVFGSWNLKRSNV